jgi:hemerythrin-like domain-containing protein
MRVEQQVEASSRAVERLVREHANIAMLLVMLDSYFAAMKAGDEVDDKLVLDAMRYLTEFVDSFHHSKVDLAVDAVGAQTPATKAIRSELAAQHDRIRLAGAALRDGLENALLDEPVPRQALADGGFDYTRELRRNMALEEAAVFPALAKALDADAWARIDAILGPQRDPLFGEVVHQRYANLFRELTGRFGCEIRYE